LALSEVEHRVKFITGVSSDSELSALYTGALAYVLPSYYEGFGLTVLEAMRCRVPVVCNLNSSLVEVGGERVVAAATTQARDLAVAVEQVMGWPESKRRAWVAAAEKWQRQFTWEKTAKEMAKIYEEVIK
jgi:glycosyltransferase involved in cell wall biosynthesis